MSRSGVIDDKEVSPRDFAARAAWLSYVGGLTQDQIAQELGISRQRAQRLVARATSEGLVRVRIAHPIAACLELERDLVARYGLSAARVAPHAGAGSDPLAAIAPYAAPVLEQIATEAESQIIAIGTGRALSAAVEQMHPMAGAQHRVVALTGNIASDGEATAFEVVLHLAEKLSAPHYPMAVPVVARRKDEYDLYMSLPHVSANRDLARRADTAIVGIGHLGDDAPLLVDGFITQAELDTLQAAGAAGEIVGHVFDGHGRYLDHPVNERIAGVRIEGESRPVVCIGGGPSKLAALKGALNGRLISTLVTDELTAKSLLSE